MYSLITTAKLDDVDPQAWPLGSARIARRDPCTAHGDSLLAVLIRHDGVPKRGKGGAVNEGRQNLGIVFANLFRTSRRRCCRGLRGPDRLRAVATLNFRYGTTALIPPGARHAFKGIGPGTSRVLVMLSPGHGEGFFREVEKEGLSPKDGMDPVNEIAAKYGVELVGPPLD